MIDLQNIWPSDLGLEGLTTFQRAMLSFWQLTSENKIAYYRSTGLAIKSPEIYFICVKLTPPPNADLFHHKKLLEQHEFICYLKHWVYQKFLLHMIINCSYYSTMVNSKTYILKDLKGTSKIGLDKKKVFIQRSISLLSTTTTTNK